MPTPAAPLSVTPRRAAPPHGPRLEARRIRARVLPALVASLVLAVTASPARAQTARQCVPDPDDPGAPLPTACRSYAFDIEITAVTDPFGLYGAIAPGSALAGTFTTFEDFADLDPAADTGRYVNAVECLTLELPDRVLQVELEPVEVTLPPASSDPGVTVMNDIEQGAPGFSLFTDSITWLVAGPGSIDPDGTPDPDDTIDGGGGFSFGVGDSCFTPGQSPCPRLLVVDDGFPDAPGDTTGLTSALLSFDFLSFANEPATAQADLLAIVPTDLVPCPEPGGVVGMVVGAVGLAGLAVRRRENRRA